MVVLHRTSMDRDINSHRIASPAVQRAKSIRLKRGKQLRYHVIWSGDVLYENSGCLGNVCGKNYTLRMETVMSKPV